jgi:head-tail adaptor
MSIGKMNTFCDVISTEPTKDAEGFVTRGDNILASVRAYFEPKNSTEKWSNMAQFSEANALFRFRKIPDLAVTPDMVLVCEYGRYNIVSAEDVKSRGMYIEALAIKEEGSA